MKWLGTARSVLGLILTLFPALAQEQVPRFEPSECGGESEGVDCGWLIVKESRSRPDSRTLSLWVVVLHSHSATATRDPVVFLSGGPGGSSVEFSHLWEDLPFWKDVRGDRDLIFFDQRGTGYSEPTFCPGFDRDIRELRALSLAEPRRERIVRSFQNCRNYMLQQGLDFAAYNSAAYARDLDDLRQALGYEKLNLVGFSYGTRVALTAMRDVPDAVRTAILASPAPPTARFAEDIPENLARALDLVFQQCADDVACRRAFPALEEQFYSLLDDLQLDPMPLPAGSSLRDSGGRPVLNGTDFSRITTYLFNFRGLLSLLPLLVREVKRGNGEAVSAVWILLSGMEEPINWASYYLVRCYEGIPFEDPEAVAEQQAFYPRLGPWFEAGWYEEDKAICNVWQSERAGPIETAPVTSDIPTLIVVGEFDYLTPLSYGRLVAETLTNATLIEMRGVGHGTVSDDAHCLPYLMQEFVNDPWQNLDTSCTDDLPGVQFVTDVYVSPGMSRLTAEIYSSGESLLPSAWLFFIALPQLTGVLVWPVTAIMQRFPGAPVHVPDSRAQWVAGVAAALGLVFAYGLGEVIWQTQEQNFLILAVGVPGWAAPLFWLPPLATLLTIVAAFFAAKEWRERRWEVVARIHYSVVVSGCVGFVTVVVRLGLW